MKNGIKVLHKEYGKGRVVGFLENGTPRVRFDAKTIVALPKEELEIIKTRYFAPVVDAPEDTILPKRGSKRAAGYDFYAPHDFVIPAHGVSKLIHFNVKAHMKTNEYLQLKIRSGLSVKHNILLCCSGVIDADFHGNPDNDGNIGAKFMNVGDVDYVVLKGERCMQGVFSQYLTTDDDEADGERGGGYGSTGK